MAEIAEAFVDASQFDLLERDVRNWGKETTQMLKLELLRKGVRKWNQTDNLYRSLRFSTRRRDGFLERISFNFYIYGIYIEHGVGRGVPKSRVAQSKRKPKLWISMVLPKRVDDLADILSKRYADIAAGELRLLIPGVVDASIKVGK